MWLTRLQIAATYLLIRQKRCPERIACMWLMVETWKKQCHLAGLLYRIGLAALRYSGQRM